MPQQKTNANTHKNSQLNSSHFVLVILEVARLRVPFLDATAKFRLLTFVSGKRKQQIWKFDFSARTVVFPVMPMIA